MMLYDAIAEGLRTDPELWYRVALAELPGNSVPGKALKLFRALSERGLRVGLKRDHDFAWIFQTSFEPSSTD